jgi:hypothetical protein
MRRAEQFNEAQVAVKGLGSPNLARFLGFSTLARAGSQPPLPAPLAEAWGPAGAPPA